MHILICNDDGFEAPGLYHLAASLSTAYQVTVVAPDKEQSGMSRSITYRSAMALEKAPLGNLDVPAYRLAGTPADCVRVAFGYILDELPDVVFSGINCGFNLSHDAPYSGTVAAALEALYYGVPAIAVSVEHPGENDLFTFAARQARGLFQGIAPAFLERRLVLNMNVPAKAMACPSRMQVVAKPARTVDRFVCEAREGRVHYVRVSERVGEAVPHSDLHYLEEGLVTVSPLNAGCDESILLDLIQGWMPGTLPCH